MPTEHNQASNKVFGQKDFHGGGENHYKMDATPETLYWGFSLSYFQGRLFVADTGNHRVVSYEGIFE